MPDSSATPPTDAVAGPPTIAPGAPEPPTSDWDARFAYWFRQICVPDVLEDVARTPLLWERRPLAWDVAHEIMAFVRYSGRRFEASELVALSNNRYGLLDEIWPGPSPDRAALDEFYVKSATVLPWGHGVFMADHDVEARRRHWLRRVDLLQALRARGVRRLVDYGAGGGHTSLIAWAMGFDEVVHHEYAAFHPFVAWRVAQLRSAHPGLWRGAFTLTDAMAPLRLAVPVDAVLCMDVPEHVHDPVAMLQDIHRALAPGGTMAWVAVFEETISCHLHGHLRGHEEALLRDAGFERLAELPVTYQGHTGLYRRMA